MSHQSIVIDIDECLLHSFKTLPPGRYMSNINIFKINYGWVVLRPGAINFLNYCLSRFKYVILWSAGDDSYVAEIVINLNQRLSYNIHRAWSKSHCHPYQNILIKPLSFLSDLISLDSCWFVDDNINNSILNPYNHIVIPPFDPNDNHLSLTVWKNQDRALPILQSWLDSDVAVRCADVRCVDKSTIFENYKIPSLFNFI